MDFLDAMLTKAKSLQKRLVLAKGTEPETIKAARVILNERLAVTVTLLGKKSDITKIASKEGVDLSDLEIIEPEFSSDLDKYAEEYSKIHINETMKHKNIKHEKARTEIIKPLNWGAMMVRLGRADAVVGGAESSSVDVLNAGLDIIGTAPGIKTASSATVLLSKDPSWGVDGAFIFSDCSIIFNPTAEELSDITLSAAQSCRDFLSTEPVVALLSYSTKGSKSDDKGLEKVRTALKLVKKRDPKLIIDGEMQVDAALLPSTTDYLAPGSPVRGKVNTLIFPDMEAGNIGYQLARSFGKASTYGPFLQGLAKPISYIPHGAMSNRVVVICAATLARAK
ncbi:MAG: phosphate acetyltransferase [Treponema sp.]|nr:phosphate acetyltransferase [Treponema sp.]